MYIAGPSAVRGLLAGEHTRVESAWPAPMRRLMGTGALATTVGASAHRDRRRAILRSLRRERLERYLPAMRRIVVEELRRKWIDRGGAVEVYSAARAMTTRAAARVMLGIDETCPAGRPTPAGQPSPAARLCPTGLPLLAAFHRDLTEYAEGFFAVPVPLPGTAYYKVGSLMAPRSNVITAIVRIIF